MKKFLIVLIILVLNGMLLLGCSGTVTPPVDGEPSEEILALIREYTSRDNVVRWPDGVVSVCDITGKTEAIWKEINEIIGGPVSFELTDDTAAKIGIEYLNINTPFFTRAGIEEFCFIWFGLGINSQFDVHDVYNQVCLIGAGIAEEKAAEGFSSAVKTVMYWLYRLEPGYPLM